MPTFQDKEFGEINVRRSAGARNMKASVAPSGTLRISLPSYVPIFMAKRMVASSRDELRKLMAMRPSIHIHDGMPIGKSHTLHVRDGADYSLKRVGQQVILTASANTDLASPIVIEDVRRIIRDVLRREAKHHLPRRLAHLAQSHGFEYTSLRFTHASSRWGSCNQKRAISLNIALMNLPFELIDYVLVHELAHTKELNHSPKFWDMVEEADPNYKAHRKSLKSYSPGV